VKEVTNESTQKINQNPSKNEVVGQMLTTLEGLKIVHRKNLETFQKVGKIQFKVWLEGFNQ